MIIDSHVHMFPEKIAGRTLEHLSQIAKSPYHTDGTAPGTIRSFDEWGIDGGVVMHIATKPSQQKTINTWAVSLQAEYPGRLFCCGSVHPDAEDALEEIASIRKNGLHGIKLHPDYQNFMVEDPKMYPIYEAIAASGLPVVFHTGWDPLSPNCIHASAKGIRNVAKQFPTLKIVAAHMGGMRRYEDSEEELAGTENVWFDTAMSFLYCNPEQFLRLCQKHGTDRILFGSDCPWSRSCDEKDFLLCSGLKDGELEDILWKNAAELFSLSI